MGCGTWTRDAFKEYSTSMGRKTTETGDIDSRYSHQDLYKAYSIQPELDPKNVMRECRDSKEHPNTVPVILALDVTGSMGSAAAACAKKLNSIMTSLYENVTDVEFMIMAIGDLAFDDAPIQISQFESDIRIAEQLDKVYFEGGGGGNAYESYTAAWYMASRHTDLDCWKRGKKGILITLGDEPLNPYLPKARLSEITGDSLQADIETLDIYNEASKKYDIFHIVVKDKSTSSWYYTESIDKSWTPIIGGGRLLSSTLQNLPGTIIDIITERAGNDISETSEEPKTTSNEISW